MQDRVKILDRERDMHRSNIAGPASIRFLSLGARYSSNSILCPYLSERRLKFQPRNSGDFAG